MHTISVVLSMLITASPPAQRHCQNVISVEPESVLHARAIAMCLESEAEHAWAAGWRARAARLLRNALNVQRDWQFYVTRSWPAQVHHKLARVLLAQGKLDVGSEHLRRAYALYRWSVSYPLFKETLRILRKHAPQKPQLIVVPLSGA